MQVKSNNNHFNFLKSGYLRNIFTLTSGTAFAQLIPILVSPVLSRLYTPEEFGNLALFLSLLGLFGSIATGRFAFAIVIPKKRKDILSLISLSFVFVSALSLLLLLVIILFNESISGVLNNEKIGPWLYLIPFSVFISGMLQIFQYYRNKENEFKTIVRSTGANGFYVGLGFAKTGTFGLIASSIIGQILEASWLINRSIFPLYKEIKKEIQIIDLKNTAKEYYNFIRYSAPSSLLNVLSIQIPILILTRFFEKASVGFYFQAHKVLSMSVTVVGNSIAQAYLNYISQNKNNLDKVKKITRQTISKMLLLSIIPAILLMLFGEEIFSFILGSKWAIAGNYAQYLTPWLVLVFIGSPLSMILEIYNRQKLFMRFNFCLLAFRLTALLTGYYIFNDSKTAIILYSSVSASFWLFLNLYILHFIFKKNNKNTI
ncbi:MAG: oligosaccharide flippase family protein [Bacteroidales bacterium]|nr:oligosaccharide flippase family protein [Bacteroidales bacterium]